MRNTFHNGNFTIADVKHEEVRCDKPIYLGAAITELAKLHMYHFFYDQVIPFWKRENVELLMTDTDSLMLEIKTRDLLGDINKLNAYNGDWIEQEGNERNGEIRVFKSETSKDPITEFVGLHASSVMCSLSSTAGPLRLLAALAHASASCARKATRPRQVYTGCLACPRVSK